MITFDLLTIFPAFFGSVLDHGVLKRALTQNLVAVRPHNLRDYSRDKHRSVDDRPFGGGPGMVLKLEPIFAAVERLKGQSEPKDFPVVLLSASGRLFNQECARRLSQEARICLICGRYEGVDERVAEHLVTEEISVGNFVLSGGELAACIVMDAVARLLPGVLGNEKSAQSESFTPGAFAGEFSPAGLLDFPQYTRPMEFQGWEVPSVLVSGNHQEIEQWRRQKAIEKTLRTRPDVAGTAGPGKLEGLKRSGKKSA